MLGAEGSRKSAGSSLTPLPDSEQHESLVLLRQYPPRTGPVLNGALAFAQERGQRGLAAEAVNYLSCIVHVRILHTLIVSTKTNDIIVRMSRLLDGKEPSLAWLPDSFWFELYPDYF